MPHWLVDFICGIGCTAFGTWLGMLQQRRATRNARKLSLRVTVGCTIPIADTSFELAPGDTIVIYGSRSKDTFWTWQR